MDTQEQCSFLAKADQPKFVELMRQVAMLCEDTTPTTGAIILRAAKKIERLQAIVDAQQDIVDYYEAEHDRDNYADEDVPKELREFELQLLKALAGREAD